MAKKKKVAANIALNQADLNPVTEEIVEEMADVIAEMFEEINADYIDRMSNHIAKMGTITASDIHILEQWNIMNANIDITNKKLAAAAKTTQHRLQKIYQAVGLDNYIQAAPFYAASGKKQVPFSKNTYMQNYIKSISDLTNNTFKNLSHTTVMSKNYKKCVDKAIYAITSGVTDYKSYMRKTVNDTVKEGLSVEYASGRRRRLDSAVRMNVLDGVRQVNNEIKKATGREFGADGVQISAHGLCAPDHLHIQGKRMTNEKFEIVNGNLTRPIGELNCRHSYRPILMDISVNPYSKEELQAINDYANETITIDGKEMTRYQASQVMRNLETQMRYAKEELKAAKNLRSEGLQIRANKKIKRINKKYDTVTRKAGLQPRRDRMYVSTSKDYAKKLETRYRQLAKELDDRLEKARIKALEKARAAAEKKAKELKAAKAAKQRTAAAKATKTKKVTQSTKILDTPTTKNYYEHINSEEAIRKREKFEKMFSKEDLKTMNTTMQKLANDGVPAMRVKSTKLNEIFNDGRFRTQHDNTGFSGGYFDPEYRKNISKKMFGWEEEPKATDFEKYGYLSSKDTNKAYISNVAGNYGDVLIEFKDEVKDRTTLTFGDSLDDFYGKSPIPTPMRDVDISTAMFPSDGNDFLDFSEDLAAGKIDDAVLDVLDYSDVYYIELQYHGELTLADIKKVTISESNWEALPKKQRDNISGLCNKYKIILNIWK